MTSRFPVLLLSLAALTAATTLTAQQYDTQQAAPVERSAPSYDQGGYGQPYGSPALPQAITIHPAQGIMVRSTVPVTTVSATAAKVELRLDRGLANITVHKPTRGTLIQVDLPTGQAALIHDGLYTFNADTATLRVLKGQAEAYPGGDTAKALKVKEDHQLTFGADTRPEDLNLADVRADLLTNPAAADHGYTAPYGYSGYPYAYGYPYGYPYGWGGYPYLGVGFGWYGGFGRGFYGGRGFGGRGFRR